MSRQCAGWDRALVWAILIAPVFLSVGTLWLMKLRVKFLKDGGGQSVLSMSFRTAGCCWQRGVMNPHRCFWSMFQCFVISVRLAAEHLSNLCHVPMGSNDWIKRSGGLFLFWAGGICIIPDIIHHSVVQSRYLCWSYSLDRRNTSFILRSTWDLSLQRHHRHLLRVSSAAILQMILHKYFFLLVTVTDVVFKAAYRIAEKVFS